MVLAAGASATSADAGTQDVVCSPGLGSDNLNQVPLHIPVNACGNTVSVVGLHNPSFTNTCINA